MGKQCIALCQALPVLSLLSLAPLCVRAAGNADLVDTRLGTDREHGSCVVGTCLPHASVYPSPDSEWPVAHPVRSGQRHGAGAPTSGWWPGDRVTGFSMLHAQGTGGTPSYGLFRVSFGSPSALEIREARPYRFAGRLTDIGVDVAFAPTAHGAIFVFRGGEPEIDVRGKLGGAVASTNAWMKSEGGALSGGGTYSGNWNPAPYDCWFHATKEDGVLRIAVSFRDVRRARRYHDAELKGRSLDDISAAARRAWNGKLDAVEVEGLDETARRRFYSHLFHAFVQPRDRTDDFAAFGEGVPVWDDHYTLWDTWKTVFPLMSIVDPQVVSGCVNSFAARFKANGMCASCFTQGREYKVGQGGDEADCVIAEAYAKKLPGVDWAAVAPLLVSRVDGRTRSYRMRGWAVNEEREDYCERFRSGSATFSFAFQDYAVGTVLKGLAADSGRPDWADAAARLLARSANWTNAWNAASRDAAGFAGFACGRDADGRWLQPDPRMGFNETFYEANGWEYSFFVPHDVPGLIAASGGRAAFMRRLEFALASGLVSFDNEPSFQIPWLFDCVGRRDLACRWARELLARFPADGCPGDDDAGAMASLYVFLTAGFYSVAGTDLYALHAPQARRIVFRVASGRTFAVEAPDWAPGRQLTGRVTLNGHPLQAPFIRHVDIVSGGTLVLQ